MEIDTDIQREGKKHHAIAASKHMRIIREASCGAIHCVRWLDLKFASLAFRRVRVSKNIFIVVLVCIPSKKKYNRKRRETVFEGTN